MLRYFRWQLLIAALAISTAAVLLWRIAFTSATVVVPASGGTYVEAADERPRYLNPLLAQPGTLDSDLSVLIFSGLVRLASSSEAVPDLADSWEVSGDGRTYTVHLKAGIRWHDGEPFSADDVLFTISLLKDPDFQGNPALAELWHDIKVSKVDDLTIRFELQDAFAPFIEYLTLGILPRHLLSNAQAAMLPANLFNASPVGTGPFRVREVNVERIELEPFLDYYGQQPYLQRLVFQFYPNTEATLLALRQGKVNGVRSVPSEMLDDVRALDVNVYTIQEYAKMELVFLNTKAPPFDEVEVRRAFAIALDRSQIIQGALNGQGEPAYGPIPAASWAYRFVPDAHDGRIEEARALLSQKGWVDSDGDGVRERDGRKLKLVLLTNTNPTRVRVAEEIVRQLHALGFEGEVQAGGWEGIVRDFLVPRRFQAVLAESWSPNLDPDVYPFWHSSQIEAGLNFSSWANRRADEVLERARRSTSKSERTQLYGEFQELFVAEEPSIILYYPYYRFAVARSIQGIQMQPIIQPSDRFANIAEWYINSQRVTISR